MRISIPFPWRELATTLLMTALVTAGTASDPTSAATPTRSLSEAWSADAVPADGYDLVLELDPTVVYAGGLLLNGGTNAIHGHGAVVDLEGGSVRMFGYGDRLDVDEVVFINGGSSALEGALHLGSGTKGHVRNCVFYGSTIGLRMEAVFTSAQSSSVTNCIFVGNTYWGAMYHDLYTPPVVTSVAWANGGSPADDYAIYCGCPEEDPASWTPAAESGCFRDDPRFVAPSPDPITCDFHLQPGSPCSAAGTPAGTNIGAYPDTPQPIRRSSWSGVKGAYRGP